MQTARVPGAMQTSTADASAQPFQEVISTTLSNPPEPR